MDEPKRSANPLAYLATGAAIGAVVGAGVALYLAPDEEARRRVKGWVNKEAEALKGQKERLVAAFDAGREAYANAQSRKVAA